MKVQPSTALSIVAFVAWSCVALAAPLPQSKERSKSDADINAIGHRQISRDVNFYSLEHEKELGAAASEEVERSSKLVRDPAVTDYIERVAHNVAINSDAHIPITVRVIDSNAVTAFTLAGGYQYVSRGLLLRLDGEGELASVLARGIAHTALRSATREGTKSQLMLATIPVVVPGSSSSSAKGAPSAIQLSQLKMKRDDELDADYFGLQYLYKAGYDPTCFINFVQQVGASDTTPKVFSAYPPLDERLRALRNEIAKILPPRIGAIISTPEFNAFKERLRTYKPEELNRPSRSIEPHNPTPS